ncbi:MAG TPA: hypothetical protein VK203_01270 [Nostocaceae cyanobacterium]|nr:hypothetical protein [Nostocaceae cyanobacterium]
MQIIRDIESKILDQEFKKYQFLYRQPDEGIAHILKVMGDLWRDIEIGNNPVYSVFRRYQFVTILKGLSHCIRWTTNHPSRQIKLPNSTCYDRDKEALEFLKWGTNYEMLSRDHVAWSKNILSAQVDENNKIIQFLYPPDLDAIFFLSQLAAEDKILKKISNSIPIEALKKDFHEWISEVKFEKKGFRIPERLVSKTRAYSNVLSWLENTVFPEISSGTLLNGYTLEQFRRFYASLFINCQYWTWLEDGVDQAFGVNNELGTCIMTLTKSQMIKWLHNISNVDIKAVESILEDLIFDTSHFHADLRNQPFILSNRKNIFLLPRLFANSLPQRMLSGALNKGTGKQKYEKIIEVVSTSNLLNIASKFKQLGLTVVVEKTIKYNGRKYTPDLIILDVHNQEILIVEYKHTLNPLGTSEVLYKLKELEKGISQLKQYLKIMEININNKPFHSLPQIKAKKIYAMLLFNQPMPLPVTSEAEINIIDWPTLNRKLSFEQFVSFSSLIVWLKSRPDLPKRFKSFIKESVEVEVAGWKYIHPIVKY